MSSGQVEFDTETKFNLCLSGGGFRASLFHLGVVRRLIYLGLFNRVERINSVSGGSIVAGLIMKELAQRGSFTGVEDFDVRVIQPFIDFVQKLPRNKLSWIPLRVDPLKFANYLEQELYGDMSFNKLTETPIWFCYATSLDSGKQWRFTQKQIGDSEIGFTNPQNSDKISIGVAASACFEPYFKPLKLDLSKKQFRWSHAGGVRVDEPNKRAPVRVHLSDGGIYDNLAVESVVLSDRDNRSLFVSDASGVVDQWRQEPKRSLKIAQRSLDVALYQMNKLMRRHVFNKIKLNQGHTMVETMKEMRQYTEVTPEGMQSPTPPAEMPKYADLGYNLETKLGRIRTDLNAFHDAEIHLLIWNGMAKIDAILKRWNPQFVDPIYKQDVPPLYFENFDSAYDIVLRGTETKYIGKLHKQLHFKGMKKFRDEITSRLGGVENAFPLAAAAKQQD